MTRLRMLISVEYTVQDALNSYGTTDVDKMCQIDEENLQQFPAAMIEIMEVALAEDNGSCVITVQPA